MATISIATPGGAYAMRGISSNTEVRDSVVSMPPTFTVAEPLIGTTAVSWPASRWSWRSPGFRPTMAKLR